MTLPPTPPTGLHEGGCAFADGAYVPLSEAKVSLFDWGFTRSDATYDVASTWEGAFFRLDTHMDRFFASLEKMRMSIPYSREALRAILHGCVGSCPNSWCKSTARTRLRCTVLSEPQRTAEWAQCRSGSAGLQVACSAG